MVLWRSMTDRLGRLWKLGRAERAVRPQLHRDIVNLLSEFVNNGLVAIDDD